MTAPSVEVSAGTQYSVNCTARLAPAGRVDKRRGHGQLAPLATLLGVTTGCSGCALRVAGGAEAALIALRAFSDRRVEEYPTALMLKGGTAPVQRNDWPMSLARLYV